MVFFNWATMQMAAKIVYYGPALSGKTTNLEWIYSKIPVEYSGKMVSLRTQADRTIFFDFLPLDLGMIDGFRTRFMLYTVPGQVHYNSTRQLVLRGAPGDDAALRATAFAAGFLTTPGWEVDPRAACRSGHRSAADLLRQRS